MKANIDEFGKRFKQEYNFLYDNRDMVAGFCEAVDAFDEYLRKDIGGFKKFVREFVEWRKDFISSDREAAAFMFTMEGMGMLV